MMRTARRIKENLKAISRLGMELSPAKMNVFRVLPTWAIAIALGAVFRSSFGDRFMYQHSMKAPDEMCQLNERFYGFIGEHEDG